MSLSSKPSKEVFDPFANSFDPDAKPFDPTIKNLNPNVEPFAPSLSITSKNDLSTWQVVAAEYTGKAVAILLSADSKLQVCTSPSFNSKCSHKGIPCLDWDSVELGKERSSTPEPTNKSLHDSGVENFTDNSSEEIEKISRVAEWSAEATRHTEEWTADASGHYAEWQEFSTGQTEWTEGSSATQGWVPDPQWPPTATNPWPIGHSEELRPGGYHITVEYHSTDPNSHYATDEGYMVPEEYPSIEELPKISGFGNDPVVVFQPYADDSWSEGLGFNMSQLNLGDNKKPESPVDTEKLQDQERIRKEFKSKILSNVGSEDKETKIREDLKMQVFSRLSAERLENESRDEKTRVSFKDQVLSTFKQAPNDNEKNEQCDN